MRYETFCIILIAFIALTAFVGFSTSLISDSVLGDYVPETEAPKPVKVTYLKNPNIPERALPLKLSVDIQETEAYTDYSGVAETAPVPAPAPAPEIWAPDQNDVGLIAMVIYNEAECCTMTEQAAVAWCVLNRVDDPRFPDTVREVVTSPRQFAFSWDTPVLPELCRLADDVMCRHHAEKSGEGNVGRVLPSEYCFFWGDGRHNYFRVSNTAQTYYDWYLESPYEE